MSGAIPLLPYTPSWRAQEQVINFLSSLVLHDRRTHILNVLILTTSGGENKFGQVPGTSCLLYLNIKSAQVPGTSCLLYLNIKSGQVPGTSCLLYLSIKFGQVPGTSCLLYLSIKFAQVPGTSCLLYPSIKLGKFQGHRVFCT